MALYTSRRRPIVGWRALSEEEIAQKQEYADTANPPKDLHSKWLQIVRIINQRFYGVSRASTTIQPEHFAQSESLQNLLLAVFSKARDITGLLSNVFCIGIQGRKTKIVVNVVECASVIMLLRQ